MSTVHHYRSNLRDIRFNLFEFLRVHETVLGRGRFTTMDRESVDDALRALERLCSTEIASSFAAADLNPPVRTEAGEVVLPESLKRSLQAYMDADWHRLELPTHLGGFGAPPSVIWGTFELLAGAHPAVAFYMFGSFISKVIDRLGTDAQKARYLPQMIDRRWGAAMVLTEPDAGSDVGAARTRARPLGDGTWEIEGTKRFITNGTFDATENVVHLVLARPDGAGPGTKGLSLFIVPTVWVEADGTLGPRNGVVCSKLEKKMGIRASVTCEMVYGGDVPARGLLMGEVHDGIRQMFHVIEHARMAVGIKSMATLSTAYLNALSYARDRVQGADLTRAHDKKAPRVAILQHADVRRMLMTQKCFAEGMRALALFTASTQDAVELSGGHGGDAREMEARNDLLLPLVKGYCSEKVYELLSLSLQTYGGSGYCQDFPIEQYVRDQKIDTLYEGTTQIQAQDLFFRKVGRDGGATLQSLLAEVRATLDTADGGDALAEARGALAAALGDVEAIFMAMLGRVGESLHHVGMQGNRILFSLAELVIGWLLVRHAALANDKLAGAEGDERGYYLGKIASANFYAQNVLPGIAHARRLIEASRLDLMELPDNAW